MRAWTHFLLGATAAWGGSVTHAQSSLRGRVMRGDSTPMANVRILASSARSTQQFTVSTDSRGRYDLSLPAGQWMVEIRAIGFKAATHAVQMPRADTAVLVTMLVDVSATPLEAVVTRSTLSQLDDFETRRGRGIGTFFTREEIHRMQPRVFTDVLRRAPGIYLRAVPTGFGEQITAMSSRTRPCPVAYVVNGSPLSMPDGFAVDSYIAANDVVAVEVYSGSSRIPAQFNSSISTARCGVVVIWTRNGKLP